VVDATAPVDETPAAEVAVETAGGCTARAGGRDRRPREGGRERRLEHGGEAGYLLTLAEREEKQGDTDGAARIKRIAQELLGEAATEAEEVGTPENTAQLEAEAEAAATAIVVVDPFYYAAVTGDLAKRAVALAKASGVADPDPQLDTLISLAKSAGGRCEHDLVARRRRRPRRSRPRPSTRSPTRCSSARPTTSSRRSPRRSARSSAPTPWTR
jgi:hypothetical protein